MVLTACALMLPCCALMLPCCALMLELLFGHVNMPAWGAECSAVLAVVWACECMWC